MTQLLSSEQGPPQSISYSTHAKFIEVAQIGPGTFPPDFTGAMLFRRA
jgi:hypothetical protein